MNEHQERLHAMTNSDGTWDLSDNDIAAITWALDLIRQYRHEIARWRTTHAQSIDDLTT